MSRGEAETWPQHIRKREDSKGKKHTRLAGHCEVSVPCLCYPVKDPDFKGLWGQVYHWSLSSTEVHE